MSLADRLSIKSKLIILLVSVALVSVAIVNILGYMVGADALRNSIFNQLKSLRASKAAQVEAYFQGMRSQVEVLAEDQMLVDAVRELQAAFRNLRGKELNPDETAQLLAFYEQTFLPKLAENVLSGTPQLDYYLPNEEATRYLHLHYIAANPQPIGSKDDLDEAAGDLSPYREVHRRYHPIFRNIVRKLGYYDFFLIDVQTGDVLYTVEKETDFAANLLTGPYSGTGLAAAYKAVKEQQLKGFVKIVDFRSYPPTYHLPAAFIAGPIFDRHECVGVLAFQLSVDDLNRVMTGGRNWQRDGFGKTGETILVGPDYLMRSESRFLLEDPERYLASLAGYHVPERTVAAIRELKTSVLQQKVQTEATEGALGRREENTVEIVDYRGTKVLVSYAPLNLGDGDLEWAVIAKIDSAEAMAPIDQLVRRVGIVSTLLLLGATLVAMLLAASFVRPIERLIAGAREVGRGNTEVRLKVTSQAELGELAHSFNAMVQSLDEKARLVREKNHENEKLLLSILPRGVAKRLRDGEDQIADSHASVTVLIAELVGFTELVKEIEPEHAVALLNDLVCAFDDATEKNGVEKFRTVGTLYMAVGGLSMPRPDHHRCLVDFARDMVQTLQRFNRERGCDLVLSIGISSGPVVAGLVGGDRFIYDLWGDTVRLAGEIRRPGRAEDSSIRVTGSVYDRIRDIYRFKRLEDGSDVYQLDWT